MAQQTADQIAQWAEGQSKTDKPRRPQMTNAERALILQLDSDGLTQVQIAQRLGRAQSAVSDWLAHCRDSTDEAKRYLKGSALRMARNIVRTGLARDHVQALKGLNVLDEPANAGFSFKVGQINIAQVKPVSPQALTVQSESVEID